MQHKPQIRYGILDDLGAVIRWQWNKPSNHYKYIKEKLQTRPVVDWNNFEPAMF